VIERGASVPRAKSNRVVASDSGVTVTDQAYVAGRNRASASLMTC
jgi:hypothetical protein